MCSPSARRRLRRRRRRGRGRQSAPRRAADAPLRRERGRRQLGHLRRGRRLEAADEPHDTPGKGAVEADERSPALSRDGRLIAYTSTADHADDGAVARRSSSCARDGSNQRRLTENDDVDVEPQWTPAGRIMFTTCLSEQERGVDLRARPDLAERDGSAHRRREHRPRRTASRSRPVATGSPTGSTTRPWSPVASSSATSPPARSPASPQAPVRNGRPTGSGSPSSAIATRTAGASSTSAWATPRSCTSSTPTARTSGG